jgi:hypothetical protein
VYSNEQLEAVGASAADHVAHRSKWIHRRVEQIFFPRPSDRIYRRKISIDFTIPDVSPVSDDQGQHRYYIPLSLLERWPPLLRLDLRGPDGEPIPLLTSDQNSIVDAALLRALASRVLKESGLDLTPELQETINRLTGRREAPAQKPPREDILLGTLLSLIPPRTLGNRSSDREALAGNHLFVELAGAMPRTTMLWLRVNGKPGDREIVKISYDAPFRAKIKPWSKVAFGLKPLVVDFQAPHLGGSGSYHLAVSVPSPLLISDSALLVQQPRTAEGNPNSTEGITGCTSSQVNEDYASAQGVLSLYAHSEARDARFYVSGPRTGGLGKVRVATVVARSGLIRPGAMAGGAITLLLALVTIRLGAALADREAVVTTLLVAPALLAYLVVRPGDHAVVGQYVGGLRRALIGLGALPLAAAAALGLARGWTLGLKLGLAAATLLALALTLILAIAWRRGSSSSMRPFSEPVGSET